jgi:lipopolysaccharide export system permease protein
MKFADRLVGKGLDTWIVIQLISYNLAWMVVLVVPMSVLVATLMAFGSMAQNNEITIMKTSGLSLYKMLIGPCICSIIIGYLLILFNNDVLPDANHKAKVLMEDISQKKPTLSLEPGVFSQEVTNYAILCRQVDPNSNRIFGVTIYDYTDPQKTNIVTAKNGTIYFAKDQSKLIMDLFSGEIHEADVSDTKLYRKLEFTKHRIIMNSEQFLFQQSAFGGSRGSRELSAKDMLIIADSLGKIKNIYEKFYYNNISKFFYGDNQPAVISKHMINNKGFMYDGIIEKVHSNKNNIISSYLSVNNIEKEIDQYMVEVHKKYAIPAACIIFLLIGAPLGIMTRRSGFGMAASISLFFFLIYWASLIGGEKLADRDIITPFWGMWFANVLLGILGLILTVKVAKENVNLEFTFLKKLIPKNWRMPVENTDEDS